MEADNLLAQHKLLLAVISTDWATRLDHKVAAVIIERYMRKLGNSRASLRYLETATGAQRPNVIASTRRLVGNGVFHVVREGAGTRPTEYALNFQFPVSGIVGDTSSSDSPSGIVDDTSCGIVGDTSNGASGIVGGTETYLRTRLTADVQVSRNVNTPDPLASGLAAAAGSRDPFEDFWTYYPRKFQKPKARAAWNKINADVHLAERIVAAARAWAEHYQANPIDKKWMPTPANWLAGERYDEDLPEVYVDAKEAAIAKKKAAAKPVGESVEEPEVDWIGEITAFVRPGRHKATVTGAMTESDEDGQRIDLLLNVDDGKIVLTDVQHSFHSEHQSKSVQDRGQEFLRVLSSRRDINDISELVGAVCDIVVARNGAVTYRRSS